jgi:hypothetical protein
MVNPLKIRERMRSSQIAMAAPVIAGLVFFFASMAPAQQPSVQDLLSQADDVLRQMSQLTGLPIKGELHKQVVNRSEVGKYITQNMHDEMTPEQIHAQEALVRVLGVVPHDFDLEKFTVSLLTEQAAGFYDPKLKTMFIADWVPPEMQSMTLTHELTHALQDQNFDLENYMHAAREDDDATAARQAVVEGYATATMMQQATGALDLGDMPSLSPLLESLSSAQLGDSPTLSNAPFFFRYQLMFPYLQGLGFVQAGLKRGHWRALDDAFEHPPTNTKEIFEPETYFDHQDFPTVDLPRPPALEGANGLHYLTANSLGELGYYGLIGQLISENEAKELTPGWLADHYLLYEHSGGDEYVLVGRVRWSNAAHAEQFFRDYHTILAAKHSDLTESKRSSADEFIGSAGDGAVFLFRHGDECVWAEGVPTARSEIMLEWLRAL